MARSNVSTGIKGVKSWKLVTVERRLGERRAREFAPTLVALQRVANEAETDQKPTDVKDRIAVTLKPMGLFDKGYQDISRLPWVVQHGAIKLGAGIPPVSFQRAVRAPFFE